MSKTSMKNEWKDWVRRLHRNRIRISEHHDDNDVYKLAEFDKEFQ